jgi:2-polyprenyl-6-methoxyphenol hydroxylase-like FAD-dependent oxidoreductase
MFWVQGTNLWSEESVQRNKPEELKVELKERFPTRSIPHAVLQGFDDRPGRETYEIEQACIAGRRIALTGDAAGCIVNPESLKPWSAQTFLPKLFRC